MIRMLVLDQAGCEHDAGLHPAQDARQPDGVRGFDFEMGVAVQFDEFDRRAQQGCGLLRFGHTLRRRAVGTGFTAGTDDQVDRASKEAFLRDDPAAAELDVVGVRSKDEERRGVRRECRCRLHRNGRSGRG